MTASRTIRIALAAVLAAATIGVPLIGGCAPTGGSSTVPPAVAPVNTAPEPLENTNLGDTSAEEQSEAVPATTTP